jgi:hypothetical protein
LNYKVLEELFQKRGWIHELDYDKIQDDEDNSSSIHDLDFGLTNSIGTQSISSITNNDLLDQIERQKMEIKDLQANIQKSLQIQQYLSNVINDRTLYESTKHQINEIIKNYDGKSPLLKQPINSILSKSKRKPLSQIIKPVALDFLLNPLLVKEDLSQKDLTFQKLKEKLLTSPVSPSPLIVGGGEGPTYDFVDSDEEEVDDLEGEINSVLSLF